MKVILNTDIVNLGEEGDIVEVSLGYARNYLLPERLVSLHNKANLAIFAGKQKTIVKHKEEKRREALSIKERIDGKNIEFQMSAGDSGKLFGAVTAQMLVDSLKADGINIERRKIDIPEHTLKTLGDHRINIRLYGKEEASIIVRVVKNKDDSPLSKNKNNPQARETLRVALESRSRVVQASERVSQPLVKETEPQKE